MKVTHKYEVRLLHDQVQQLASAAQHTLQDVVCTDTQKV